QRMKAKLQDWKGRVWESAKALAGALEFEKSLELKIERVYHYASLQLAENSANNEYLARIGQVQNLLTKIGEAGAFVVPEIQAIDDETFAKFIVDSVLAEWRIKLHKIRRMKPHVLSEPEERLLALGNVALSGYDDTFSQLTDVDMKFGLLIDETGRERPLTQSSFSSFLVKRDHELRKRAFHQFYAEFQDHQYTLAASLAYSVKADVFHACARENLVAEYRHILSQADPARPKLSQLPDRSWSAFQFPEPAERKCRSDAARATRARGGVGRNSERAASNSRGLI